VTDFALRWTPHLLAGGLCAGIAAANAVRAPVNMVGAAVFVALASLVASGNRRIALLALALVLAGWWWGSARLDALDASWLVHEVGRSSRAQVVVTEPARRGLFDVRVPAQVRRFGRDRLHEPVLLKLPPGRAPPQGAELEVIAKVERPRAPENGFDEQAVLRRRGVHVVLRASSWRQVGERGGPAGVADRLRARLAGTIAPGLKGERQAVIAGVVLGEDEGLTEQLRDDFRASGLYHLLAVSGQNVALLAGGVLLLAWIAGVSRWVGEVGALTAIVGYVVAVGWQPSVVRAGVAGILTSLAWLVARPRDRWYFLLLGAAVLLAWNPYSLLEPGFQLSFTAVAAIFVVVPRLGRSLEGYPLPRWLREVLAVSAACGLATAPIVLFHFDAVPAYAVLSNAFAAPAVGPLLGLALVTSAVGPVSASAAATLAWVNGWLAAYVAGCARVVAALPYAELSTTAAVLTLGVGALMVLAAFRLRPPRGPRLAVLAALSALVLVGWRSWPDGNAPPPPPTGLRMTVLDVGQGDSIVLQVPEGAVVVDQGPPEANVARQLGRIGVRRIAMLVLTHPQRDHVGGAEQVLETHPVDTILDPALQVESSHEKDAIAAAREEGVPIVLARAGQSYHLGRLRLRVLWPEDAGAPGQDPNENATVLLASYGKIDVLLPADSESGVTLPLRPPPVEVLKLAHHGSADDGLARLLGLVRPDVALISCGANNDYGHPAPSTLATLESAPGLDLYRTDEGGRITLETDGRAISVETER
jgi:competence protein ComEC